MVPRGDGASGDFVAPAERALSFLSKSLQDVRLNADRDLKMMTARSREIGRLAKGLNDWENIKIPSLPLGSGNEVSAGRLLRQLKDGSRVLTEPRALEDLDILKTIKEVAPSFSQFPRSQSDPSLQQMEDRWRTVAGLARRPSKSETADARRKRLQGQQFGEDWELLKKMRQSLKEIESSASGTKSPTEFFENMKKHLRLPSPKEAAARLAAASAQKSFRNDVPLLDVPGMLENLVRQSEPLLDQLGVKKEVSDKMCDLIRGRCWEEESATMRSANKLMNLDSRLSSIKESTGYQYNGGAWEAEHVTKDDADAQRRIAVVTTASLPWMTGTSVNPLFRAAYLARDGKSKVTLLVPWLSRSDQEIVYPNKLLFDTPQEQELYVRDWLRARVGFEADFKIAFYPGKYSLEKRSIFAVGDILSFIPEKGGLAVLEEPEHLTWYHHGGRWQDHFMKVVGIVHTNYLEYAKREKNGELYAFLLKHVNNLMCKTYCHKVVRLSAATQDLPKSVICNVHGVSPKFLEIGEKMDLNRKQGKKTFSRGAYFLGKMIWTKGYRELLDLVANHREELGDLKVDVYGSGDDQAAVRAEAQKRALPMKFFQGRDHGDATIQQYKVFINPSVSDVVCTTTAEALAMGKIVVCADHSSNEFFRSFPNCYTYRTPTEFVEKVRQAMEAEPVPLSDDHRHALSWEAATERFLETAGAGAEEVKVEASCSSSSSSWPQGPFSEFRRKGSMTSAKSMPNLAVSSSALPVDLPLSISTLNLSEMAEQGTWLLHQAMGSTEPGRRVVGAIPHTGYVGEQQCRELGLPHPWVQRPVYTW